MTSSAAMRIARAAAALLTAAAFLASPLHISSARADSEGDLDRARQHFEVGRAHFDEGRYRDAIIEFTQADAIVESPINRYNIGLCHDRLGNDEAALREYRAYLEAVPEAPNRREVAARIAALEQSSKEEPGAPEAERPSVEDESAARELDEPPARDPVSTEEPEPEAGEDDAEHEDGAERESEPERWPPPERRAPPGWDDGDAPAGDDDTGREAKPLYKSWWFWGVAGVSAVILVNILTSSSSSRGAASLELHEPTPSGGMTLWRF